MKFIATGLLLMITFAYAKPNAIYQVSMGNALMAGLYHGAVDFEEIAKHGDMGLGSVENMDGEMVAIDGKFYRIDPEGKVNIIPPEQTTPYAITTHFKPEQSFTVKNIKDFADLVQAMNKYVTNRNILYAVRIDGQFNTVKLRSVHGQEQPYPPFAEVTAKQSIFNLKNVAGTGVGFFYPAYMHTLNTAGYHIHFMTGDRSTGGHILETSLKDAKISIMPVYRFTMDLPKTKAFADSSELAKDNRDLMVENFGPGVQLQ